jgi:diguanylate cyclase (GGDEF)-like protein/PAS domain S-box-containing protein
MTSSPAHLRITTLFTRLTALLACLVAVLPLLGYGLYSQANVSHKLSSTLRVQSMVLEQVIALQPEHWMLNGDRIQAISEKIIDPDDNVHVCDVDEETVFRRGRPDQWYFVHKRQTLYAFGLPVGSINAGTSIATELWVASLVLLVSLGLAAFIWGPLRKLPLAALTRADRSLTQRTQYQRALLDNFPYLVWLKDADGKFLSGNQRLADVCGLDSPDQLLGRCDLDFFPADLVQGYHDMDLLVFKTGQPINTEELIEVHGKRIWFETYKSPVVMDGQRVGTVGFARDITERKQTEDKLTLAASVFANAREGIMITTMDSVIVDVNEAFTRITGYGRDEVLGKTPRLLKSDKQSKDFYSDLWRALIEKGHWFGEIWNRHQNGDVFASMQTISTVRDAKGVPEHFVSLFSDVTVARKHQKQLEKLAHFDALTGLPNRVLLADRLKQGMLQAQRHDKLLAVAYLDLDGFKAINDNHGHEAGDQLLIALASRMKHALRDGDTLARIGGDEFVVVLLDLADVASCIPLLTRLLEAAAQPVPMEQLLLQVSASVGVTFHPQPEVVEADQLLRQADQSMYQAKLAGKNRFHLFDAAQDRSVRGHHESLDHIRQALAGNEFVLYYQPKVNMRTGVVVGAEALIRWQHPEQGLLSPAQFLPVIEEHPLAVDLGEWVIHTALAQMALWHADGLEMPISVNVGARQLQQKNFAERLQTILAAHPGIKPGSLQLELLETSALEDLEHVSQVIEDCRALGVGFALDDFGTGYSSLIYLKRLPVDVLKIDQSFVRDMLDDSDDLSILVGVIGLAHAFHRQVVAEGVETVSHGVKLLQLGCELAQGYGVARPMPAAMLPGWVATWRPDPAWTDGPAPGQSL